MHNWFFITINLYNFILCILNNFLKKYLKIITEGFTDEIYQSTFDNICHSHRWIYRRIYPVGIVTPDIAAALKILSRLWKKEQIYGTCSFRKKVLFKESPPSIMVTRKPDWSTEILWYGTGYVKEKKLSPLKRSAWGRLHCWLS